MFESIPNALIASILEFLGLRDYCAVSMTCRKLYQIISDHKKFWTRECLKQTISFDLESYSEIYDSPAYRNHIEQKSLNFQKPSYKKLVIDGFHCRKNFAEALSSLGSQQDVDEFLIYFYETLKQPLLPLANLKRETILCSAQTIFQNKLSEVLYEDSGMVVKKLAFPSLSEELINELQNLEDKILKENSLCNKESLIKARWYWFENKQSETSEVSPQGEKHFFVKGLGKTLTSSRSLDSTNDEVMSIKSNGNCLLDLYNCICSSISHFCGIISCHLNSLDNTYDLLAEYTARWNTYVSSMIELENVFKTFTELLNKTYENVCQGYPCFPKFSIWRLMTKLWIREVYEKSNLSFNLNESFLRILYNHRDQNIKESLNANFSNLHLDHNKSEELPKCLYVNLKTKYKKNSTLLYQNADQLNNSVPACFESFEDIEKKILSSFMQSVLDLSLNEVSIHYLDCTEIATNYPYQEIEEGFLKKSNEFYQDYQQLFTESPDYFCHFLKADCSLISEILPQRTHIKLETLLIQNGFDCNKEFIKCQLEKVCEQQLEKVQYCNLLESENEGVGAFIENFVAETLKELNLPTPCSDFYKLPSLDFQLDEVDDMILEKEEPIYKKYANCKVFLKKFTHFLCLVFPNLKRNFEYLHHRLEEFEKIRENDKYIKEMNTSKNIPFEMGDCDRLFYDLEKNVDADLLQKLSEDYNNYLNEDKDNSAGLDLPILEEVMGPNNGLDDLNFDVDFNNLDLFALENPSLRRAPL